VSGLASLARSSEAVMRYSELGDLPTFNIKFDARLTNVNVNSLAKGRVSENGLVVIDKFPGEKFTLH
jgi:hypothetical protein